ncbi:DUF3558 domain-containing protein [uncultured Jatrophihabitans sp.]|uniref:DUF3558 domain-containing protein n=1 Tax=uncultured Jatrophihabitans sp. TaxID=1610747 RepID=UPI0035CC8894
MKKFLAVLPLVLLLAACGTSGGGGTTTVTRTVTATVTAPGGASTPADSDAAGASSASAAAAAAPDACSLLTQAEAEKLARTKLMKPVGAGANAAGKFVGCQFTGPTTGPTAQVEIYVGDGPKSQLHIDRDNLKHKFTTVPGVGDQCLQEDGFIFVEKNGLWASIHLVRFNDAKQNLALMRTAIAQLAARLP